MNSLRLPSVPVWLRLGRVSNLPTVWSNVLAGSLLAAPGWPGLSLLLELLAALSLFYVGGMYLNDAFDREIDARERPTRPIPAGQAQAGAVFAAGFAMLAAGWLLLARHGNSISLLCAGMLAALIVLYNLWHKGNPASPLLMGGCRALVYLTAGSCVAGQITPILAAGALLLMAHIIGLTYAAKQENRKRISAWWPLAALAAPLLCYGALLANQNVPVLLAGCLLWLLLAACNLAALRLLWQHGPGPMVGRAVAQLIAATSLLDGLALAATSNLELSSLLVLLAACIAAWLATRSLQTIIPGT